MRKTTAQEKYIIAINLWLSTERPSLGVTPIVKIIFKATTTPLIFIPRLTAFMYFMGRLAAEPKAQLWYTPFAVLRKAFEPIVIQKNFSGIDWVSTVAITVVKIITNIWMTSETVILSERLPQYLSDRNMG